jgi:hypothetical protein
VSDETHPGEILNKMNIYMNKEYRILQTRNVEEMELQINAYASKGWSLEGDLKVLSINGQQCYNQTMVREKRDINESPDNGKQLLHG